MAAATVSVVNSGQEWIAPSQAPNPLVNATRGLPQEEGTKQASGKEGMRVKVRRTEGFGYSVATGRV